MAKKFVIIERAEIRKGEHGREELFVCFEQVGRVRTVFKRFVAFAQIPSVLKEFEQVKGSDFELDTFDVSFETKEDFEEELERFL